VALEMVMMLSKEALEMVMMLSKEALEMVMMLSDPAVLTRANWQEYRPTETLILLRASKFHVVKNHCATLDLLRKRSPSSIVIACYVFVQ
jgi:hypothetical protein